LTTIETSLNSISGFKFDLVGAVDSNFNGMLMSIKNVGVRIQTTLKSLPTSEFVEKKIKGMLDAVKNSFDVLNQIATLTIDDKVISVAESFKTTITDINTKLKHAALDLPNHKNVKQLNAIISYVNRLNNGFNGIADTDTESVEKNINNYIKFIDKVNTVEIKKLETSAQMFKQMASFSNSIKGNFEKLAETLAEDLMPILEELKTIMGQVPEKLDTGFQNTSASIAATTAAPTRANITAQVGRENPNLTREQIEKVVDTRLNEKANNEASSPLAKLDELINLLKGTTGNAIVQIKS
jgi:Asp-tRNA(Asn)/Glu-tRNA(Gln) amidotransferase C subunit